MYALARPIRYEFLECLCRAGIAKYGKGIATDSVPEAVRMLLEQNLDANLPFGGRLISNDFRNERLYNEEVDLLYKRHAVILKTLYSRFVPLVPLPVLDSWPALPPPPLTACIPFRYRLKPPGGGIRTKVIKIDGWLQLMNDAHLLDQQFTIQVRTDCGEILSLEEVSVIELGRGLPVFLLRLCCVSAVLLLSTYVSLVPHAP